MFESNMLLWINRDHNSFKSNAMHMHMHSSHTSTSLNMHSQVNMSYLILNKPNESYDEGERSVLGKSFGRPEKYFDLYASISLQVWTPQRLKPKRII
jgi:hypothetical protein